MRPEDLDDVLAVERVSFPSPWTKEMFRQELESRTARAIVFRSGEEFIGYLCFWEVLDEAHLLNIAVHPQHRGRGHGKAMMEHLDELCFQNGLRRIILEVRSGNKVARELYRACGFHSIGFRARYYADTGEDALVMEKWLRSGEAQSPSLVGTEGL
jgi:ribosomal-protein-alanine N-acetyltransferase